MLDLRTQYARISADVDGAIARVVAGQRFIGGAEVEALERSIAERCDVPEAVACGSGSDALLLSLMALGVGPGDRVVCPAFTFFSTAAAITRLGAVPVFADIDPESFCSEVDAVRRASERAGAPAAIIVAHLFGRAAAMDPLVALAAELDVPLVEDAAQAIAARDDSGNAVGGRGDLGCLSFYPTKNLGAYGDGGMVLAADTGMAARLRLLRDHGGDATGRHEEVGINSRLDAVQAAVLAAKLPHLDAWTNARQSHAAAYRDLLGELGAGVGAGSFDGLVLPVRLPAAPRGPASHVFHHYVLRVPADRRDALRTHLARAGIDSGVYYPVPLHRQPCFASPDGDTPALPAAEAAAREVLSIPVHPELSKDQIGIVVDEIRAFFERTA